MVPHKRSDSHGADAIHGGGSVTDIRRLQLFMGTRLSVATLLLGATLFIVLEDDRGLNAFTPQFLIALIATIYGISLVTAVWMLGSPRRSRIAVTQLVSDLLLTTGLLYVTGGTTSGFTFLYGVAVLMAAMVVGPQAARATGAGAILLYGGLAACLWFGWVPPPPDQSREAYLLTSPDLAYAAVLQLSGLLLVTLLAGNLAARLHAAGGQLKRAEASAVTLARLNDDIVRSMSSGLMTTDDQARVRTINAFGQEILGGPQARIVGQLIDSLLPDARPWVDKALTQSDATISRAECSGERPDGTKFPLGLSVTRLINMEGDVIGALIVFQDLTEIEQLRKAAARQERLAVLGRLSAGLAHEIRNPLSSISGSVQLVQQAPELQAEDKRLLGIVLSEVERLDELVATMLEVGRPREPELASTDLRELVKSVVHMARGGQRGETAVTLKFDLPASPVMAVVDGSQVRQVIWNLVKNALQASPPGTTVTVSTRLTDEGLPELRVADEGAGLDAGQQAKVYDMFHSERTHGTGIGLALVRQIVDAHHGRIDIDSDAGQGAQFIVTFPRPLPREAVAVTGPAHQGAPES